MYDAICRFHNSEARRVYATLTPAGGTLTIQATPTVSVTRVSDGTAVVASGTNVTGYDAAAGTAPQVWYKLDAGSLTMAEGNYALEFTVTANDAGGNASTYRPRVLVIVE